MNDYVPDEKIMCECGWAGHSDDLVCDVLHEEAGRTIWVCPRCGRIDGKGNSTFRSRAISELPWWKCTKCGWIGKSDSTGIVRVNSESDGKEYDNRLTHQCPMCKGIDTMKSAKNPFLENL